MNFFFLKFRQIFNYCYKLDVGFVCSGSQKDKQNTFKVEQIQERSLTNYLHSLKETLGFTERNLTLKCVPAQF